MDVPPVVWLFSASFKREVPAFHDNDIMRKTRMQAVFPAFWDMHPFTGKTGEDFNFNRDFPQG